MCPERDAVWPLSPKYLFYFDKQYTRGTDTWPCGTKIYGNEIYQASLALGWLKMPWTLRR